MYSSYSAAVLALRASKPSLHAHSSYSYGYLPPHHCHRDDDAGGHHRHHHELLPQSPYLSPRFLLDGYLLRHSPHLLLLSAHLRPPPPPHSHPPRCCRRRAAARFCNGGSGASAHGRVSWRAEPLGCRCSGRGATRSDLDPACRRLEARGCCCGGSGGGRLLGAGPGRRNAPRLVRRAVRQEVWEYDGEWSHRRCSTECQADWEDEEEECVHGPWEVAGDHRLTTERWCNEDDYNVDAGNHCCRDCGHRKGYNGGDPYSGRQRDMRDADGYHGNCRDSDRRRQLQRDYHDDDEEDLDFRRRRQNRGRRDRRELDLDDTVDTRMVGTRRYNDDVRKYDRRRESRDSDYDDAGDVRRAGRYAEDTQRFDRRTETRDFEIDDEVDVRREGRRRSNDDERYAVRRQRREYDGDDSSLLRSRRRRDEEFDYDDQDLDERRYYSEGRSQKSARESDLHEDDAKRASSSTTTVDAKQENSSSSRVRWRDNVDRRTSEMRDQRYSVGWSSDQREAHDYDEAQYVKVRDARTRTQDVKVITEDDSRLASSSNNKTILKHSSNVDQKETALDDESRNSSQNITEISEVRGNNMERDTRAQSYYQEDRRNIENRSSSLQSSVKVASESRKQVDQHSEVNQQVASLSESRKNTEKFTAVTTDSSRNVSSASHMQRNYDEVNRTDIDDRSASVQNITHVTRDKKRIVNQQVIHETDRDVQNLTHVDIAKVHASDISVSRNSQNYSQTGSDVNVPSSMNFNGNARIKEEQVYGTEVSDNDSALVKGSQSHLEAGASDWVHSTSSTNISKNTKESRDQVEVSKACTSSAAVASTSESHLRTTADDQVWSTDAVNTIGNVNEQCDLAKIHVSDGSVAISSQSLDTRTGNQVRGASTVNLLREHQGMSDQQSAHVSVTQRNDEQRIKYSESFQVSREKPVRLEDTERLMQHHMDLIWQQVGTSGISHDKDTTNLLIDSTEAGSSMDNTDIPHQAIITQSNVQNFRNGTTAGSGVASGSNATSCSSMLESAARLEKSSTFHFGQFVDELQKGVSDADTASRKKNEKPMVEGITSSSSRSQMKGPADEMWDVQSATSQETFKTADKDEGFSADGATNSASQTPKNELALAKKGHKSLWAFVADIIRLGWIQRGDAHNSSDKSVNKSSSSNSQSTEGWLSSQEHDNDGIRKKDGSTKVKDQQLIKSHSGEPESRVVSFPMEENLHTGMQGLQMPDAGTLPRVTRSEGDLLVTSSKADQNISAEELKQSIVGESPKGSSIEGSAPSFVDVTIGHSLDSKATTSSRITAKGLGENTGKGNASSVISSSTGSGADWRYVPSGAITPYHHSGTQVVMPHDSTAPAILESPALPVGGSTSTRFKEKNVVQETPEVTKTDGKDDELKRRMFQRNKQVLKETFDEWEEAYQHDAEVRKADELFMREALLEAKRGADIWEVPVGAVLVQNGEIIARGCNLVEDLRDSTAHAEIVCIREASNKLKTWRLADTTLYVTLEPCAMCAGAILQARIDTVVWGAPNKLLGADGSWVRLFPGDGQTSTLDSANQSQNAGPVHPFHPKITIRRGVLSSECSEIMQQFFQLRRRKKQKPESPPRARQQGHHHPIKFFSKMHNMFGTSFCM